mmetsp:Transcript_2015/g.7358  ORF Transcript_2015/g.7358 Transcript_2015/m.7358 type:complete len:306 (-) Transcript_2015:918-1835(-)
MKGRDEAKVNVGHHLRCLLEVVPLVLDHELELRQHDVGHQRDRDLPHVVSLLIILKVRQRQHQISRNLGPRQELQSALQKRQGEVGDLWDAAGVRLHPRGVVQPPLRFLSPALRSRRHRPQLPREVVLADRSNPLRALRLQGRGVSLRRPLVEVQQGAAIQPVVLRDGAAQRHLGAHRGALRQEALALLGKPVHSACEGLQGLLPVPRDVLRGDQVVRRPADPVLDDDKPQRPVQGVLALLGKVSDPRLSLLLQVAPQLHLALRTVVLCKLRAQPETAVGVAAPVKAGKVQAKVLGVLRAVIRRR